MGVIDIVTKEDLAILKMELLDEIKKLLQQKSNPPPEKRYLKSYEVMKILNVSSGTLQKIRNTNKISFFMDEGAAKYEYEDVIRYMEERKNAYRKNRKNIPFFKDSIRP